MHFKKNDDDLEKHIAYIHVNLVKHGTVLRAADWPYSAIHREIANGNISKIGRGYFDGGNEGAISSSMLD